MRGLAASGVLGILGMVGALAPWDTGQASAAVSCPPSPETPLRYHSVEPILAQRCASCHDARRGDNPAAQRAFEMTRYPFTSDRGDELLGALRRMFETRSGLSDAQRCTGLHWIDGGALDDAGRRPVFSPP